MGKRFIAKTIDIHNMTCEQAKKHLEWEILRAGENVDRIVIIHGCNGGTVLRDMVRKRLKSPRILDIIPTFSNDGETTVYLKK